MKFVNIKFTRAWVPVPCHYCGKELETGEYMITWRKVINWKRNWYHNLFFHPECFIESSKFWLDSEHSHQRIGRPKSSLTEEERLEKRREQRRRSYHKHKLDKQ